MQRILAFGESTVTFRDGYRMRRAALVLLALVMACATPMQQASMRQPAPCEDSLYVQLKRTHPDSLSERAWQRLQSFDRDCAAARAQAQTEASGMAMGMGHGRGGRWMGMGIVGVVLMVALMTAVH
jgi:hypothetical protein